MYDIKQSINILIVDDTPEYIQMAGEILRPLGHRIRVANGGQLALKLIEQEIPSLILLDIKMPDIDGFEVCKILKANPDYNDIAIIFITSSYEEENISKGFLLGAQDYVIKPYNASELVARVKSHIKIIQQAKELMAAYHELDQFCHSISHDLKSPLQVINQLTELLKDELPETSTQANEIISHINTKCTQSITMIERLLEFSKMTQMACHFTTVDLNKIFSDTLKELTSLEAERQFQIDMNNLSTINANAFLISLLVQNILGNAIKFTRHKAISKIKITGTALIHNYQVTIEDNGAGFDPNYSNKLFQVFERLHSSQEFEGTGVGLAIVNRIMRRHGGSVTITAQPNIGATVTLLFPNDYLD
jgi:signal transduction histidine kinase